MPDLDPDPVGVSAAAKALHMWEHGDPTDYADPDYRECVEVAVSAYLAVAGSPADERWECCGQVFTGTPDFISGARSAHVCPPEDVPDAETAYGLGKTAGLREVNDLRDQVQMYEEKAERDWRDFGEMQDARIAADDRVVALTRALEFYADANNYVGGEVGWWGKRIGGDPLWCMDFGVIARNALAGVSAEATGVWPDQSAQHAVLLEQIKDAYAEGKADAVALIRERAALALPDLARFTLDEVEAIVGLSAEAAPDGILDELRRPNDEPHVAPSSNPYPRDGATFAGSPEAIAYDRGFAAGLAARDTNEPKEKP